jgi:hypothetical protein
MSGSLRLALDRMMCENCSSTVRCIGKRQLVEGGSMALPDKDMRQVRIRCPETRRWRVYELDPALDVELVQRLNDIAFLHGAEVVSTCEGHDNCSCSDSDPKFYYDRAFANVRFAIFFRSRDRLLAQQARLCIDVLAKACTGADTVVETFHEPELDLGSRIPRADRLGRSLVIVRHARPTVEAPALAKAWWRDLVSRLEGGG